MISPMRLENFELEELIVRTKEPGPGTEGQVAFSLDTRHTRHDSQPEFTLRVALSLSFDKATPASFEEVSAIFAGTFAFPPNMSDEVIRKFYPVVAMANLLGILRGSLLQTTSMFKGGPFELPLLNLNELTLMNEEAEKTLFPATKTKSSSSSAEPARTKKQITARSKKA